MSKYFYSNVNYNIETWTKGSSLPKCLSASAIDDLFVLRSPFLSLKKKLIFLNKLKYVYDLGMFEVQKINGTFLFKSMNLHYV